MLINGTGRRQNFRSFLRDPEEGGGGEGGEGGAGGEGGDGDKGDKGGKEFVPITSQEELDKILKPRLQRATSKYADYDTLKAKAEQWDTLEKESQTDAERRERELRDEALNEAMSKAVPRAVRQAFRAEAKGVLSKEQLDSLLEDLDLTKYADDEGDPDEAKIAKKVGVFAGKSGGNGNNGNHNGTGFGQGSGHQQSTAKRGEGGLNEAKRRFPEHFKS